MFQRRGSALLPMVLVAALATGPLVSPSVDASGAGRGAPVTVAVIDALPVADASAVVMRRYNESPHDVILLQSSAADAALLISAVFVLLVSRELEGDSPRTSSILRVSPEQAPREWQISEAGRAKEVVSRALRAAPREVPGVGRVSAVEISLRPGVLRGKLRAKP